MMAVLIITAFASMFLWVGSVSSGKLIQAQVDTKESALIIDFMKTGTDLIINKNLSITSNEITSEFKGGSFSYLIFNPKVSLQKTVNGTEVKS